ncbi:MAG: dihydropteroate synthase [Lentisphaeria bacterium]
MQTFTFHFREQNCQLDGQPKIMGILNLTPDSFSDGGKFNHLEAALQRALQMQNEGADFLDLGGESTRPGCTPVSTQEELQRVLPVIEELRRCCSLPISIDTSKAAVAEAALAAGASIVNDVTALRDPDMPRVIRKFAAGCILMHDRQLPPQAEAYQEVALSLQKRLQWAVATCALSKEHFVVDPGIGFGKSQEQNLALLKHVGEWRNLGIPVLVGMSNKSFIGRITGQTQAAQRLSGTIATAVTCLLNGCDILRVHQVLENRQALQVATAIRGAL